MSNHSNLHSGFDFKVQISFIKLKFANTTGKCEKLDSNRNYLV